VLQWALSLKADWQDRDIKHICAIAAATSSIDKLEWLAAHYSPERCLRYVVANESIIAGALQSLQWLAAAGFSFDNGVRTRELNLHGDAPIGTIVALMQAHFVRLVSSLNWRPRPLKCCVSSSSHDSLTPSSHSVQHLLLQGYTDEASSFGQLAVLQYLIDVAHCPWDPALLRRAAAEEYGTVATLQWLAERDGTVWSTAALSRLLDIAGQHGNLAVAQWLRAQRFCVPPAPALCRVQLLAAQHNAVGSGKRLSLGALA
jgi:hypothetical protein